MSESKSELIQARQVACELVEVAAGLILHANSYDRPPDRKPWGLVNVPLSVARLLKLLHAAREMQPHVWELLRTARRETAEAAGIKAASYHELGYRIGGEVFNTIVTNLAADKGEPIIKALASGCGVKYAKIIGNAAKENWPRIAPHLRWDRPDTLPRWDELLVRIVKESAKVALLKPQASTKTARESDTTQSNTKGSSHNADNRWIPVNAGEKLAAQLGRQLSQVQIGRFAKRLDPPFTTRQKPKGTKGRHKREIDKFALLEFLPNLPAKKDQTTLAAKPAKRDEAIRRKVRLYLEHSGPESILVVARGLSLSQEKIKAIVENDSEFKPAGKGKWQLRSTSN